MKVRRRQICGCVSIYVIWEFTILLIHCTCICHVDVSKRSSSFLVIIMYSLSICFTLDWIWSNISRLCQFLIWMKNEIMAILNHRCLRTEPPPPPFPPLPSIPVNPPGLHSFFSWNYPLMTYFLSNLYLNCKKIAWNKQMGMIFIKCFR